MTMTLLLAQNPYQTSGFFSFFALFFQRLCYLLIGKLSWTDLATDEIQFFALFGVGVLGTLVGTFLLLRRMTMVAGALSHTLLFGIVSAFILVVRLGSHEDPYTLVGLPLLFGAALATAILTTTLAEWLNKRMRLSQDASIGLVFFFLFSLGILLLSLTSKNLHLGGELIVGNVDAMRASDLSSVYIALSIALLLIALFFRKLTITTFDPPFAKALGISCGRYHYFLMALASLSLVTTFRVVGVLMTLAFFIAPPLIARLFTKRLKTMLSLAVAIVFIVSLVGVALVRAIWVEAGLALSTSGIVVCCLIVLYLVALFLSKRKMLSNQSIRR